MATASDDSNVIQESLRSVLRTHLLEKRERTFFHTTSFGSLQQILKSKKLEPKNVDNPFVSFSEIPFFGDISGNDVVISFKIDSLKSQLLKVDYSERWFDRYREQGEYIAGEGWREQFTLDDYVDPEDFDEFGDIDPDVEEAAYREGALQSFLYKNAEREWITKKSGQAVKFKPQDIAIILVNNATATVSVEEMVRRLGYDVEVGALGKKRLR